MTDNNDDLSVTASPVPRSRTFTIQSYSRAASFPNPATTPPCAILDTRANPSTFRGPGAYRPGGDVRELLQAIDDWAETLFGGYGGVDLRPADRTWGFYVFFTAYDQATLEALPRAMEKWVRVLERVLEWSPTLDIYRDAAAARFRLDVVMDAEALGGAGDERVRASFQALVRGTGWNDAEGAGNGWPSMARFNVAVVLGAEDVRRLAELELREEERGLEKFKRMDRVKVRVIDVHSDPEDYGGSWRGTGLMSINNLVRVYMMITAGANSGAVRDFFARSGGQQALGVDRDMTIEFGQGLITRYRMPGAFEPATPFERLGTQSTWLCQTSWPRPVPPQCCHEHPAVSLPRPHTTLSSLDPQPQRWPST